MQSCFFFHIISEEGSCLKFCWDNTALCCVIRPSRVIFWYPDPSLVVIFCILHNSLWRHAWSTTTVLIIVIIIISGTAADMKAVLFVCMLRDWGIDQDQIANTDFSQLIHKSWESNKRCPVKHLNPITFYRMLL